MLSPHHLFSVPDTVRIGGYHISRSFPLHTGAVGGHCHPQTQIPNLTLTLTPGLTRIPEKRGLSLTPSPQRLWFEDISRQRVLQVWSMVEESLPEVLTEIFEEMKVSSP